MLTSGEVYWASRLQEIEKEEINTLELFNWPLGKVKAGAGDKGSAS